MRIDPGESEDGMSMQKVKPIITNIDSNLYRFLRTIIYDERSGGSWYIFSLIWLLSMVIITMAVIIGLSAIGSAYMLTMGDNNPALILYNIFTNLINMFVVYLCIGFALDCVAFPIYESEKEWL